MRIVWESCIYGGPFLCLFCGVRSLPRRGARGQALLAVVYGDQDRIYGEACAECLQLSPEALHSHLGERLTQLRQEIGILQELHQASIALPGLEDEFRAFNPLE